MKNTARHHRPKLKQPQRFALRVTARTDRPAGPRLCPTTFLSDCVPRACRPQPNAGHRAGAPYGWLP